MTALRVDPVDPVHEDPAGISPLDGTPAITVCRAPCPESPRRLRVSGCSADEKVSSSACPPSWRTGGRLTHSPGQSLRVEVAGITRRLSWPPTADSTASRRLDHSVGVPLPPQRDEKAGLTLRIPGKSRCCSQVSIPAKGLPFTRPGANVNAPNAASAGRTDDRDRGSRSLGLREKARASDFSRDGSDDGLGGRRDRNSVPALRVTSPVAGRLLSCRATSSQLAYCDGRRIRNRLRFPASSRATSHRRRPCMAR